MFLNCFFGTVRQKNFWRKLLIILPFTIKYFDTRLFLRHGRFPSLFFSALWDKVRWRKVMISLLLTMTFDRYQIFAETRKGSLNIFFSTLSQKPVDGKIGNPPPVLTKKFSVPKSFDTRKLRRNRSVPLRRFFVLVQWDKKTSLKPWWSPSYA